VIHYRNTTFLTQAMSKMSFPLLHQAIIESNVNKVITNCRFPITIDWITIHWTSPSPP